MGQHTPPDKALLKYMTHKYNTVIPKPRNFNLFHNENQEQLSIKLFFSCFEIVRFFYILDNCDSLVS